MTVLQMSKWSHPIRPRPSLFNWTKRSSHGRYCRCARHWTGLPHPSISHFSALQDISSTVFFTSDWCIKRSQSPQMVLSCNVRHTFMHVAVPFYWFLQLFFTSTIQCTLVVQHIQSRTVNISVLFIYWANSLWWYIENFCYTRRAPLFWKIGCALARSLLQKKPEVHAF